MSDKYPPGRLSNEEKIERAPATTAVIARRAGPICAPQATWVETPQELRDRVEELEHVSSELLCALDKVVVFKGNSWSLGSEREQNVTHLRDVLVKFRATVTKRP
jgi:hypothetical protein